MRFLFTTIPGLGHFHPLVPTARALRRRGHEVTFAASPLFAGAVRSAGFDLRPAGPPWLENLEDPVMRRIMAGELFVDLARMGMVDGVVRAARETEADAIVRCGAEIGGLLAGAILDVPVASHASAAGKMFTPFMRPGIVRAAAEHGLDGEAIVAEDAEVLAIDRTPPALETPGYTPPANAANVRPEPWDGDGELPDGLLGDGGRPLVYVTLGTVFNGNVELFRLIARALAEEPCEVLIALGPGMSASALGELPANASTIEYAPQSRVLPRAAAVVTHGGYNTVVGALGAGVPLYVVPMGADQHYNAERCVAAGAAISPPGPPPGPPTAAPPPFDPPREDEIRDAVRRLLGEPAFAASARAVAAEIAAMPPVDVAAERLETAVTGRSRFAPPTPPPGHDSRNQACS